jgi:hypothetical protein
VHVKTLQRRRSPRIPWGFGSESSGGTTSRRTCATKNKIQEFIEEKEDKDRELLDLIQTSRQHEDRPFGRTRGSDWAPLGEAR